MLLSIDFNQNDVHNLLRTLGLNDLFSVKMNLKGPLSRGSQFKSHFYWGDRETEDRAKVSMPILFQGTVDQ